MTAWHEPGETVDPGLLVRHLDGELDAATTDALERHLEECEACRALAVSLEARARRVRSALEEADVTGPEAGEWREVLDAVRTRAERGASSSDVGPPSPRADRPDGRTRRRLLAAGWVLALVGGAAVASPPLRAWVADQWTRWVDPDPPPATPASTEAPAQHPGSASLEFSPAGPAMEIVLEARQVDGTLTVRFGEEAGAATVSVRGGGEERLAVGGRGVRITNVPEARASYEVVVPRSVRSVSVRVGEGAPVELTRAGAGTGTPGGVVVVDLDRGVVVREAAGP